MILLVAVFFGLIASLVRANLQGQKLKTIRLEHEWLVLVGIIPQLIAFQIPWTSSGLPDKFAPYILVSSQILLLIFAWLNRKQPGFWLLAAGLLLNFVVILLNGGLMPISPATVEKLLPAANLNLQVGERLGTTKDILLPEAQTNLYWLSDRFTLPAWMRYRVAFSLGDILIAIGAFWLLWSLSEKVIIDKEIEDDIHEQPQPDHVRAGQEPL